MDYEDKPYCCKHGAPMVKGAFDGKWFCPYCEYENEEENE